MRYIILILLLTISVHAQQTEFKPLPRIQAGPPVDGSHNSLYIVGQPKGAVLLGNNVTPNYIVANGKVMPYTNSPVEYSNVAQTNINKQFLIPGSIQQEFSAAIAQLTDYRKQDPAKISHLQQIIGEAQLLPEVQQKIIEIRKLVHDYVNKKAPADMEALEVLTRPKEIMEQHGLSGNTVY